MPDHDGPKPARWAGWCPNGIAGSFNPRHSSNPGLDGAICSAQVRSQTLRDGFDATHPGGGRKPSTDLRSGTRRRIRSRDHRRPRAPASRRRSADSRDADACEAAATAASARHRRSLRPGKSPFRPRVTAFRSRAWPERVRPFTLTSFHDCARHAHRRA